MIEHLGGAVSRVGRAETAFNLRDGQHNLAIVENGGVIGWGRNDYGQRTVPASVGNNALAIAAGDAHSLALLASGTVVSMRTAPERNADFKFFRISA